MCVDLTPELVNEALDGDGDAQRQLIERLTPEIHFNVAKMLRRWRTGPASTRELRQEIDDMVQEVFLELLEDDCKALRRWDCERLSLCGYVSYIARIRTAEVLRSRRSPWRDEPRPVIELDHKTAGENPENETAWRELLHKIYLCLLIGFSAYDAQIFDLLLVRQDSPEKVATEVSKSVGAIYQWRSRLYKKARKCRDHLAK